MAEREWTRSSNEVEVSQSFTVNLSDGGSLTYQSQALKRMIIGPADSQKSLIWNRKNGTSQKYPIGLSGAGYGEIEFRLRPDSNAVWLIDWTDKKVVATLDFKTTRFTTGGSVMYWGNKGYSESEPGGIPQWATLSGGRSLGRKTF